MMMETDNEKAHFPIMPEAQERGQDVGLRKMRAVDTRSYPYVRGGCSERQGASHKQPVGPSSGMGGSADSIPALLICPLTKHRQRDGGEELGQPRGEPKPHAEQPHQVRHSPRASLGEGRC